MIFIYKGKEIMELQLQKRADHDIYINIIANLYQDCFFSQDDVLAVIANHDPLQTIVQSDINYFIDVYATMLN